jgi:hypothetical protein
VLDRGEVDRRVLCADAAFVVAKDHVQHPVKTVFDGPYKKPLII